jgi:hypothetical protein
MKLRIMISARVGPGCSSASVAQNSIIGKWKTIDDETHQAKINSGNL